MSELDREWLGGTLTGLGMGISIMQVVLIVTGVVPWPHVAAWP